MNVQPSRDEFLALGDGAPSRPHQRGGARRPGHRGRGVPAVAGSGPAFLLESVEGGDRWARWSFLGWDPLFVVTSRDGDLIVSGADVESGDGDPLTRLERIIGSFTPPALVGLPPLHSGLVGYLGYDMVRYIEHLPNRPRDDRGFPEMAWQAVGTLAAFDRFTQQIHLIRNVMVGRRSRRGLRSGGRPPRGVGGDALGRAKPPDGAGPVVR